MRFRRQVGPLRWFVRLRGRRQPRPRRYGALQRKLRASPALLRYPASRFWFVESLLRVDGVPVELDLTYVLPDETQLVVATERVVDLRTFRSDLANLVWNKATTASGTGMSIVREFVTGSAVEAVLMRQQENDARIAWQSGEGREAAVLRVDGREVPAIRLRRGEIGALGADLGPVRVAVAGPANLLASCELTFPSAPPNRPS